MKLAIVGTRFLNKIEQAKVEEHIEQIIKEHDYPSIVTGDATGVDSVARRLANKFNLDLTVHQADWKKYGKSAGPRRNTLIVEDADKMVAFWNDISPGTKNSIDQMKKANKPVIVYNTKKQEMRQSTLNISQNTVNFK